MDKKMLTNNVTIKTEPNSLQPKKVLLSTSPFAQLASKNLSNSRLASFKPPRDLLLTGTNTNSSLNSNNTTKGTRRTFVPNVNVTRKKASNDNSLEDSSSDLNQKSRDRDKNKRLPPPKKRNTNVVQTKGVFSEGLAPGKVKAFGNASAERSHSERQVLDKPKLNLNRKIVKSEEDSKLKSILKDDFLNDPSLVPDINFIPNCLPMVYNVKKQENASDLEQTFEGLQLKSEKISNINVNELKNEKEDLGGVFESNKSPKLLLFEFPNFIQQKDETGDRKRNLKGQQTETEKQSNKSEGLSSLGEGFLGYLRIHENGKAYFVAGKTVIPLCTTRHATRQEIMSASVDSEKSKGEVISLGTVDASFTCSANFFQDGS